MQFLSDHLRQRRANILTNLDLAGVNGHGAVFADVQPGTEFFRTGRTESSTAPSSRLLRKRLAQHAGHDQSTADNTEKGPPIQFRRAKRVLQKLVTLRFEPEIVENLLTHLRPPFIIWAASWMAATMRG